MKKALSLLCALVLLLSCGLGQALADVSINNQIKTGEGSTVVAGSVSEWKSGPQLLIETGDQYLITMPRMCAWIEPVSMYVDAPGEHSIYVYRELKLDKEKLMPFAYHGMRVTAIAEEKNKDNTDLTCIVYRDDDYNLRAGWVHSVFLTMWYPGTVGTIGSPYTGTVYSVEDPVLSWARDYFVNTRQKYTVLRTPVPACTQFRLSYQVTSRGGARIEDIVGPRTVYVNDGSGWTMAGEFDYPKLESVLVTVNLPEPTDLCAVAVIPSCAKPDRFSFRQGVEDVLSADPIGAGKVSGGKQEAGTSDVIWESWPGSGTAGPSGTVIANRAYG